MLPDYLPGIVYRTLRLAVAGLKPVRRHSRCLPCHAKSPGWLALVRFPGTGRPPTPGRGRCSCQEMTVAGRQTCVLPTVMSGSGI